jgi:hypothetical protein
MTHGAGAPPSGSERKWWWASVTAAVLSYLLSFLVYWLSGTANLLEALYSSAHLLLLHMPLDDMRNTEMPRGLLLIATTLAVIAWVLTATSVVRRLLGNQIKRWWTVRKGAHTIVSGLSGAGLELVNQLRRDKDPVVAVEGSDTSAGIKAEEAGACLLAGNPADRHLLQKTGLSRAKCLLMATGDDFANIAAAVRSLELAKESGGHTPRAFVHIADPQLRIHLRHQRTFRSDGPTPAKIFNLFDHSARLLIQDHPLDHAPIRPATQQAVQLVVIGFGRMGEAVLTRAAMTGHYANLKPLEAVVIDREADRKERLFRGRYLHFKQIVNARFLKLDAQEPATQDQIAALCADPTKTISTIVIAFNDPHQELSIAWSLADRLDGRAQIRLRLRDKSGASVLLGRPQAAGAPTGPISVFGSLRNACAKKVWFDSDLDVMAKALHEDYLRRLPAAERTRADNRSAYAWDCLDDDLVESNRQSADHIPVKLRALGRHTVPKGSPGTPITEFGKDDVEVLAKMEHRRWMAERFLANWSLGPKNIEKRTSPYLVEWEELPPEIQEYDRNFVRMLPEVLNLINLEIH